jgi:hypothetical protein
LPHGKLTEETGEDRARIDALLAIASARCIAMGLAPGMVLTRGDLSRWWMSRETSAPIPLFDAGDWRIEAFGQWLETFLKGDAIVSISWRDGRPFLADS